MTPQQADAGVIELVLPEGGHVLVDFGNDGPRPDLEASVVEMMLTSGGTAENVCQTLSDYAEASGLSARFFLGRDVVIVEMVSA
ncbi:MAG TPA: hypothetical protein VIU37_01225 [Candidatus Limnocylindrales bacterium]|jgi:hypothetical protein